MAKNYTTGLASPALETNWLIFDDFLIWSFFTMVSDRSNHPNDMAMNSKISLFWSLYANWNKIFKKKSSNNMLINVSDWHTKLGWEMDLGHTFNLFWHLITFVSSPGIYSILLITGRAVRSAMRHQLKRNEGRKLHSST